MRFGAFFVMTDVVRDPGRVFRALEDTAFDSLWTGEHSHVPVASPFPGDLGPTPAYRRRMLDPFAVLASAAMVTRRLLLGTCVCLVPQRDPVQLAKEVASVDHLSAGRFQFGVGPGWNDQELVNHGGDPSFRYQLLREKLLAMEEIWANEVAEFQGRLVRFGPLEAWPKPVQRPHPPVLIGGEGPGVLKRVVAAGADWLPRHADQYGKDQLSRVPELQRLAAEAGRGPVRVSVFSGPDEPDALRKLTSPATVEEAGRAGVDRFILGLAGTTESELLAEIDRCAGLIAPFT